MEKIHGVNLGNWLVLEKWMHPALFENVMADDEEALSELLEPGELKQRLKTHRDTYITKEDFMYIKSIGMNSVRIPVPHFVFGDVPPYYGCIDWLDKAFLWAQETGLKVLIDLHTAPDSQNGFDNGGICGVCKWHQKKENVDRVLDILHELTKRYCKSKAFFGIQLLNEPISEDVWLATKGNYAPRSKLRAEGSSAVPFEFMCDFYEQGYERLRPLLTGEQQIFIHDGFRLNSMLRYLKQNPHSSLMLDTHSYIGMCGELTHSDLAANINYAMNNLPKMIAQAQEICPIVVGEWCIAHNNPGVLFTKEGQTADIGPENDFSTKLSYRLIADAQMAAWEKGQGFYFWSYKLMPGPPGWDLRKCVENDWITSKF